MSFGQDAQPSGVGGLRVLVVEDHVNTRQATRRLLSLLGCEVSAAATAAQAREALAGGGYDLLVCDLQLPDGDGRDLLRQAREAAGIDGRPVRGIAVSGESGPAAVARTREAGYCDHLTKPVMWADLEAAVKRAAGGECPRRADVGADVANAGSDGPAAGCPQCEG
jgi:CheY-like chemotaxis protein